MIFDDFGKTVLREFLTENWQAWSAHCLERDADPDDLYEALEDD